MFLALVNADGFWAGILRRPYQLRMIDKYRIKGYRRNSCRGAEVPYVKYIFRDVITFTIVFAYRAFGLRRYPPLLFWARNSRIRTCGHWRLISTEKKRLDVRLFFNYRSTLQSSLSVAVLSYLALINLFVENVLFVICN